MISDATGTDVAYAATFNGEQDVYYLRLFPDCNENEIPDATDIAEGTSLDCDTNGMPDECEAEADCNSNGVPDVCDVLGGTSPDCNDNRVPDECEADCNTNGVADACDIAGGTSNDVNANGVPDECEESFEVLFVDRDAPPGGGGASWADAYDNLQNALAAAAGSGAAFTEIRVAEGVYTPTGPGGKRVVSFELVSGVALRGGYAGLGEPDPNARDVEVHGTVLSGDLNQDDEPDFVNYDENSHHVVTATYTDSSALLDGFTIRSGSTYGAAVGNGGGLLADESELRVSDCTFAENRAGSGGAVCQQGGSPRLTGCRFLYNAASDDGGAIRNSGGDSLVTGCVFVGNNAGDDGGAIDQGHCSTITNCRFLGNSAADGGAICKVRLVTNCAFSGNTAEHHGGAVYHRPVGAGQRLVNCTFSRNKSGCSGGTGSGGGGVWIEAGTLTIQNCIFWRNWDATGVSESTQIALHDEEDDLAVLGFNCIDGWTGELGGIGNFEANPLLANPLGPDGIAGTADDDLRLWAGSPCIDAGINGAVPADTGDVDGDGNTDEPVPLDAYGNPRFTDYGPAPDTGSGEAPFVDIGAFEHPTDCNGNGTADDQDIAQGTSEDANTDGIPDECEVSPPVVVFVDDSATGGLGNGTSWDDAYTNLHDGLAGAQAFGKSVELRTAQGVYKPAGLGSDRTATFQLRDRVALMGGYAGVGAPDPDARDPELYPTILSGDLNGDDGPDFENYDENCYHVMTARFLDSSAIVDGVVVSGGNGEEDDYEAGGGLWSWTCDGTRFHNCVFSDNTAEQGGGLFCRQGSLILTDCSFVGNSSGDGGGIKGWTGTSFTLTDCRFVGNSGGGVHGFAITATGCTFVDNVASSGGGLRCGSSLPSVLRDCTFLGNTAGSGGGGGVYQGGAASLVNCVFSGNTTGNGGGALYSTSSSTVVNCTFSRNTAGALGGGVFKGYTGTLTLANCILWGNSDSSGSGESAQGYLDNGVLDMNYCCIQGLSGGAGGIGNIGDDPLFEDADGTDGIVGTEDDDLHLQTASPCINAGTNYAPDLPEEDIDGDLRIQNCRVDLGAYETPYWPGTSPDCNTNSVADACDITEGTSEDCNFNLVPDECELNEDCNSNGVLDICDIAGGTSEDCNGNWVPDLCDVVKGTSADCNTNGIPDECDIDAGTGEDCNGNWIPDSCDVTEGTSADCNTNALPDECDIAAGTSTDCDNSGIPDECEPVGQIDCNSNGAPDACDIALGTSTDCDETGVPDECEPYVDCNGNSRLDSCDISIGGNEDCNGNWIPDECEVPPIGPAENDCNTNSVPDQCDIAGSTSQDCNTNGVPDECDIAGGTSQDLNTNGVADECEAAQVEFARSCRDHGPAGELCLEMGVGGSRYTGDNVEPRTGGVRKLVFEVDLAVSAFSADVACDNRSYVGTISETADGGMTITVEFDPALPNNDCCAITLGGKDMDDTWWVAGLLGDVDRNLDVNSLDYSSVKLRLGLAPDASTAQYDVNGDGDITSLDYSSIKLNIGATLPSCP